MLPAPETSYVLPDTFISHVCGDKVAHHSGAVSLKTAPVLRAIKNMPCACRRPKMIPIAQNGVEPNLFRYSGRTFRIRAWRVALSRAVERRQRKFHIWNRTFTPHEESLIERMARA